MGNDAVLAAVIELLERDDSRSPRRVVIELLNKGPLFCTDAFLGIMNGTINDESLEVNGFINIRAELLQFIRSTVREQGKGQWSTGLPLRRSVTFSASSVGDTVACHADGHVRDLAVLQLVMLLQQVGLDKVRVCPDPDCPRLFVKRYRKAYCSVRCQKRLLARKERAAARESKLEAATQLKRRTRTARVAAPHKT